jgi:cysteinyl-tRNA synthetase
MKLYNTMSGQVEQFQPQNPSEVKLYACGLTVYDFTHLGHLRKYTMDDVLIRTLEHQGYKVKFVQNITDVGHLTSDADTGEDKLEKGAKKYGKSVWDIASEFEEYFWRSMDAMGNLRPVVSCRATEHIEQQIQMVKKLEESGYAYVIPDDGVYFDTSKFADYGKLARLNLEGQQAGARVDVIEGKRQARDFALWKFERPGENRAMSWPSPWSERGFPGWHIECSAMAMHYLGDRLDIHTGGIDHIPVHHTNEIAQAEASSGTKPFVSYWVHHNFLQIEGEKMSKSLGNFFTIDDVLERGFDPRALRLLFLSGHYRSEMNFTWNNLAGAQKSYQKLIKVVAKWQQSGLSDQGSKLSSHAEELHQSFYDRLADDLNTSESLAVLWQVVADNQLTEVEKLTLLMDFDQILQLQLADAIQKSQDFSQQLDLDTLPENIQTLLKKRQAARDNKNWSEADRLRELLNEAGYQVKDETKGQQLWKSNASE